ncbi:hypothetical protein BGY98DRAFT_1098384 [Russula aff. rugulosa BPL654]|nr:hypothetical protein BGY98DRAFT_1098384 [Russula aff. rugulosa BPL654]
MSLTGDHRDVEQGQGETALLGSTAPSAAALPPHEGRPEISINNSSRTPITSNKPDQDFDDRADNLWSLYGKEAKGYDEEWTKVLKEDVDAMLIFAGLFSGVLTAFLIPKIRDLKVDPTEQSAYYQNQAVYMLDQISQQLASGGQISSNYTPPLPYTFHPSVSDRRVNIFWLISLICSLSAAILATLVQQWARVYMRIFRQSRNPLRAARIRLFMFEGAHRLPSVMEFVPGLIHVSLILFLWGLGDVILHTDKTVFITTVVPIIVCACLYLYCVSAPIWIPNHPIGPHFHTSSGVSSKYWVAVAVIIAPVENGSALQV